MFCYFICSNFLCEFRNSKQILMDVADIVPFARERLLVRYAKILVSVCYLLRLVFLLVAWLQEKQQRNDWLVCVYTIISPVNQWKRCCVSSSKRAKNSCGYE